MYRQSSSDDKNEKEMSQKEMKKTKVTMRHALYVAEASAASQVSCWIKEPFVLLRCSHFARIFARFRLGFGITGFCILVPCEVAFP